MRDKQPDDDTHELEQLREQLETTNVAPADTVGFGRRFAEIIMRVIRNDPAKRIKSDDQ